MALDMTEMLEGATEDQVIEMINTIGQQFNFWKDNIGGLKTSSHERLLAMKCVAEAMLELRNSICQTYANAVDMPDDYGEPLADQDSELMLIVQQ